MNEKILKTVIFMVLLLVFACDEPETTVINIIHPDGSITRRIEMMNKKNNFKVSSVQVPYDSTWTIRDSLSTGEKKDTTWFRTAEKLYKNIDELNKDYQADKGVNRESHRSAYFSKKFKWFHTMFRFSEKIDRILLYGYPAEKFFTKEEMDFSLLPQNLKSEKMKSADSTKYNLLEEGINKKTEKWAISSLGSEWIEEFSLQMQGKGGEELSREALIKNESKFIVTDSASSGSEVGEAMIGKADYLKFKAEADTATSIVSRRFDLSFKEYSIQVIMPGKVIGTNGYLDTKGTLVWPVKDDYFFTAPYEMWAESKVTNLWAWIVSALFLLFVLTGLIFRLKKK